MPNATAPPFGAAPGNCDEDYDVDELERRAKFELSEDKETRIRSLEALRSMLKDETGLRWQDDDHFLLSFLRAKKFDVGRAFHLMKRFYTSLGKHADIFYNFTQDEVKRTLDQNCMQFLPRRDSDGCSVVIFRMSTWKPDIVSAENLISTGYIGLLLALRSPATQIAGIKILLDYKGFSFKQLFHVKPTHLWFFGEILQNTTPLRMRGLHIVNENHLFHYIWIVLQQFFSAKLKERVHFHGEHMTALHKFIDPNILPSEYEGEQPAFDNSEWRRTIEASTGYINHVFSFGYEQYLRQRSRKDKKESPKI